MADSLSHKPKVSVIIPTVGRGPLLYRAIRSVLQQNYNEIEIMVVVDNPEINLDALRKKYLNSKVKFYFNQRKKGPSGARNTGILHSEGEYIAFLDDDDTWLEEKISLQVQKFLNDSIDLGLVYCWAKYKNNEGYTGVVQNRTNEGWLFPEILGEILINGTPTAMIKKSVFETTGYFDEEIKYWEDQELYVRIAEKYKIGCVRKYLVNIYLGHQYGRLTDGEKQKMHQSAISLEYIKRKYSFVLKENPKIGRFLSRRIALLYKKSDDYNNSKRNYRDSFIGKYGFSPSMLLRYLRDFMR